MKAPKIASVVLIVHSLSLVGVSSVTAQAPSSQQLNASREFGTNYQSSLLTPYSSSASNSSSTKVAWQSTVYGKEPGPGCWEVEYPSTAWTSVACLSPSGPPGVEQIGGSGTYPDEVAASTHQYVNYATGQFSMESNFGSESDNTYGSNAFSLQLNTNTSSCTVNGHSTGFSCWQQFLLTNCGSCDGGYSDTVYIQYWLLGYDSTYGGCPTPNLITWHISGGSCYGNSLGTSTGSQSAGSLDSYSLTGGTEVSGSTEDNVQFCNSSNCYSVIVAGTVLNAGAGWIDSEFNVFGAILSSQAVFTPTLGNTFSIYDDITEYSPYGNTSPTCYQTTYTGESNNMYLGTGGNGCSASGVTNIVFYEYT